MMVIFACPGNEAPAEASPGTGDSCDALEGPNQSGDKEGTDLSLKHIFACSEQREQTIDHRS